MLCPVIKSRSWKHHTRIQYRASRSGGVSDSVVCTSSCTTSSCQAISSSLSSWFSGSYRAHRVIDPLVPIGGILVPANLTAALRLYMPERAKGARCLSPYAVDRH
eukprot:529909-Rhodomonas_salina.2